MFTRNASLDEPFLCLTSFSSQLACEAIDTRYVEAIQHLVFVCVYVCAFLRVRMCDVFVVKRQSVCVCVCVTACMYVCMRV